MYCNDQIYAGTDSFIHTVHFRYPIKKHDKYFRTSVDTGVFLHFNIYRYIVPERNNNNFLTDIHAQYFRAEDIHLKALMRPGLQFKYN